MSLIESCYALGIDLGPDPNLGEVVEALKEKSGDLKVKLLLGIALQEAGSDTEAFKVFTECADLGSASGLYQQAAYLYDGRGCEQNRGLAIELMERVVEAADPETQPELVENALLNLGRAHWQSFPHNARKAEEYWLRAAKNGQGLVDAMTELGEFYAHPENNNLKESFYWHQNAAGKGSVQSQTVIGIMYSKGQGIDQSTEKALKCLKEASANGGVLARANLAELYYKRKLFTEAFNHAKKVCDLEKQETEISAADDLKGLTIAAFVLALCLKEGRGTPIDQTESTRLFKLAATTDSIVACRLHNEMIHGLI